MTTVPDTHTELLSPDNSDMSDGLVGAGTVADSSGAAGAADAPKARVLSPMLAHNVATSSSGGGVEGDAGE